MKKFYSIWVSLAGRPLDAGYYTGGPGNSIAPYGKLAAVFDSMASARAEIEKHGWVNSTFAVRGIDVAHVIEAPADAIAIGDSRKWFEEPAQDRLSELVHIVPDGEKSLCGKPRTEVCYITASDGFHCLLHGAGYEFTCKSCIDRANGKGR